MEKIYLTPKIKKIEMTAERMMVDSSGSSSPQSVTSSDNDTHFVNLIFDTDGDSQVSDPDDVY